MDTSRKSILDDYFFENIVKNPLENPGNLAENPLEKVSFDCWLPCSNLLKIEARYNFSTMITHITYIVPDYMIEACYSSLLMNTYKNL